MSNFEKQVQTEEPIHQPIRRNVTLRDENFEVLVQMRSDWRDGGYGEFNVSAIAVDFFEGGSIGYFNGTEEQIEALLNIMNAAFAEAKENHR